MKHPIFLMTAAIFLMTGCQNSTANTPAKSLQNEAKIADCIRAIMTLDEGKWAYMGTIARLNGKFRTYATTSDHASAGTDMWSARSYGGDVEADEESAETSIVKLVGSSIIPVEDGELNEEAAVKYTSCQGPDAEGRYEATQEYSVPGADDQRLSVKSVIWQSEHGSYYVEDIFDNAGRVVARRSGVNTPIDK